MAQPCLCSCRSTCCAESLIVPPANAGADHAITGNSSNGAHFSSRCVFPFPVQAAAVLRPVSHTPYAMAGRRLMAAVALLFASVAAGCAPGGYVVVGAGMSGVNGCYTLNGTAYGSPLYTQAALGSG